MKPLISKTPLIQAKNESIEPNTLKSYVDFSKGGDALCPKSEEILNGISNAAPTSNPLGAAPVPRPLEQEQWTYKHEWDGCDGMHYVLYPGRFGACMSERYAKSICDVHNTSLRALQEELVAAKQRIEELEGETQSHLKQ